MEEGSTNEGIVWQEILPFTEHARTKYEKKLQSGFRACGICPLDCNELLSRLPHRDSYAGKSNSSLNENLIDLLKENHDYGGENQKWTCREKIVKSGEVLSLTMLEQHVMDSSLETREKGERIWHH